MPENNPHNPFPHSLRRARQKSSQIQQLWKERGGSRACEGPGAEAQRSTEARSAGFFFGSSPPPPPNHAFHCLFLADLWGAPELVAEQIQLFQLFEPLESAGPEALEVVGAQIQLLQPSEPLESAGWEAPELVLGQRQLLQLSEPLESAGLEALELVGGQKQLLQLFEPLESAGLQALEVVAAQIQRLQPSEASEGLLWKSQEPEVGEAQHGESAEPGEGPQSLGLRDVAVRRALATAESTRSFGEATCANSVLSCSAARAGPSHPPGKPPKAACPRAHTRLISAAPAPSTPKSKGKLDNMMIIHGWMTA